ncbi:MAG: hypothetical protein VSS75_002760, partial [Candidatus Parabeggiatoa sp.]|nr:hypothetical protein [Candidatus Parabeggiatoa sp.]
KPINESLNISVNFATVVEYDHDLSYHEKSQLRELLEKYLIEERREDIYQNYNLIQQQQRDNLLEFSSEMNRLEEMLNN